MASAIRMRFSNDSPASARRVLGQLRRLGVIEDRGADHLAWREAEALERLALRQGQHAVGTCGEEDHRRDVDDRSQTRAHGIERGPRVVQRGDVEADALRPLPDDRDLTLPDPAPAAVARDHPVLDVEWRGAESGRDHPVAIVRMDQGVPELGVLRPEVRRESGPLRDLRADVGDRPVFVGDVGDHRLRSISARKIAGSGPMTG